MKIAYFGYDFFYSCLNKIVDEEYEVIKIFTYETDDKYNFNNYITSIANENNIQIQFNKPTLKDIEELFLENQCDLIISAAYPYVIPIPDVPNFRGINIHPTLLPIGRGVWPLPYIILRNETCSGVTIHKLTKQLDAGDIILQKSFKLLDNENLETLSCRSQILAEELLHKCLLNFDELWEHAKSQGEGEYWCFPSEEDMYFDGNMTIEEIDRKIRAFGKFDSCTKFLNKKWLIHEATCWQEAHNYKPNTIVHKTNKEVLLTALDGFVCIRFFEEELD